MSTFVFTTLTNSPDSAQFESACLGVDASNKLTDNDIGKCVKIAANNNFVLTAAGDEIEGFLVATEPSTYNSGFAFGTVQRRGRREVKVGATEASTVVPGDLVVADIQTAIDTAGGAEVQSGAPSVHIWRCISVVTGTGASGDIVVIERV